MKIIRHPLFMRPSPESELEQAIDRELRSLPELPAPASLLPRVLHAIAECRALPWWRKSYAFWPWSARLLFLAGSTSLAGLLVYFTWGITTGATLQMLAGAELGELSDRVFFLWSITETLAGAVLALLRSASPWLIWVGAGVAGASYFTTLALGTLWYRLATRRL